MTAVVIGDSDDAGAAAVVRAMAASSTAAVLVHPEQLSLARWEHTISPAGSVATRIELRDGRCLADDEIAAVLCRSFSLPAPERLLHTRGCNSGKFACGKSERSRPSITITCAREGAVPIPCRN